MKIHNTSTPVVVLNCKLGALGIIRSLGSQGITMIGVDADPKSPGMLSRYCNKKYFMDFDEENPKKYLDFVLNIGKEINQKAVLIPTSDETAVFVAENYDQLSKFYLTPKNDPKLFTNLMSKKGMYDIALKYDIPTPITEFPQNMDDINRYLKKASFPIMLKGILGNRLEAMTGTKMVLVHTPEELIENYKLLEDPESPNLMLQEYIPGDDDQVYIFNGYFNSTSDCPAAFTGHKIRQYPVHIGCASLGICKWSKEVAELTTRFMKKIGYQGILDIGYRYDARDGKYKVLDINPRIGQAFRIFVDEDGLDVMNARKSTSRTQPSRISLQQ